MRLRWNTSLEGGGNVKLRMMETQLYAPFIRVYLFIISLYDKISEGLFKFRYKNILMFSSFTLRRTTFVYKLLFERSWRVQCAKFYLLYDADQRNANKETYKKILESIISFNWTTKKQDHRAELHFILTKCRPFYKYMNCY